MTKFPAAVHDIGFAHNRNPRRREKTMMTRRGFIATTLAAAAAPALRCAEAEQPTYDEFMTELLKSEPPMMDQPYRSPVDWGVAFNKRLRRRWPKCKYGAFTVVHDSITITAPPLILPVSAVNIETKGNLWIS